MTGAFGTSGEVSDGRYTGQLPAGTMHGMNKAKAIQEIARTNDYDLSKAFAYSDSVNDLPLLVSVGNPFIINPNKELENIALKNKWAILVH
jgi:phosphoserine phosphatase